LWIVSSGCRHGQTRFKEAYRRIAEIYA